ncbi:MAG: hypothetical protein ACRC78_05640 [Planktothrix sp.]
MGTNIFMVNGLEAQERGLNVKPNTYLPYTRMTEGQMKLALLKQQADVYAQYYPEMAEYRQASVMLENALYRGEAYNISGINYRPMLMQVGREIERSQKIFKPASKVYIQPENGINADIVDIINVSNPNDCDKYATDQTNLKEGKKLATWQYKAMPFGGLKGRWLQHRAICEVSIEIEKILNSTLDDGAYHMLYKSLPSKLLYPAAVETKKILHGGGVQGLALAAEVAKGLMDGWVETTILKNNANRGVGPVGSAISGVYLSEDRDNLAEAVNQIINPTNGIGAVGVTIVAVTALVTAVAGAIGAAAKMQAELNKKKSGVLNVAQGFGTAAYNPDTTDWNKGATQSNNTPNNNLLLLGAAGLGLYFLTEKK